MIDITRESYCKSQWDEFQACFEKLVLVSETRGKAIEKTKELFVDGKCDPVRDALHACQETAYGDEKLYFQAKDRFLQKQDLYILR